MIQRTWWPRLNPNAQLAKGLVFAGLGGGASTLQYADASDYGNHGTLMRMDPATDWVFDPTLGRWCTDLDGVHDSTGDYIECPVKTASTNFCTFTIWINPRDVAKGDAIFFSRANMMGLLVSYGTGTPLTYAWALSPDEYNANTGLTFALNAWNLCAVTITPTAATVYRWNDVSGLGSWTNTKTHSAKAIKGLSIARDSNWEDRKFNGLASDAMVWNRAISPAEISKLADPSNTMLSGLILPPRRVLFPAAVGGAYSLDCDSIAFTLSSMDPDLLVGHVLDAGSGEFTLTGQAAGLEQGYALACDAGSVTLTGQDATLTATRTLSCDSGEFVLTGQDASLESGATLSAESGSVTLTGQDVSLLVGHVLDAGSGEFTLTGQDATLTYTPAGAYTITADAGSFSLTGQDATLTATRTLSCDSGTFTLTGQDATFQHGYTLACDAASFTLTGQDTSFQRALSLACNAAAFTLTGQTVTLTYSAAIGSIYGTWTPPARSRTWTPAARSRTWTPQSRGN